MEEVDYCMSPVEKELVFKYQTEALKIARTFIKHIERLDVVRMTNYEKGLMRDFETYLNEIRKIQKD